MTWNSSKHPGSTRASRALRQRVLTAWPTCYLHYADCTHISTEDDHIIPLSQGGTNDWDNHRGVCHNCHTTKTHAESLTARNKHKRITPRHPGLI